MGVLKAQVVELENQHQSDTREVKSLRQQLEEKMSSQAEYHQQQMEQFKTQSADDRKEIKVLRAQVTNRTSLSLMMTKHVVYVYHTHHICPCLLLKYALRVHLLFCSR